VREHVGSAEGESADAPFARLHSIFTPLCMVGLRRVWHCICTPLHMHALHVHAVQRDCSAYAPAQHAVPAGAAVRAEAFKATARYTHALHTHALRVRTHCICRSPHARAPGIDRHTPHAYAAVRMLQQCNRMQSSDHTMASTCIGTAGTCPPLTSACMYAVHAHLHAHADARRTHVRVRAWARLPARP
jgi:hypothetical protein